VERGLKLDPTNTELLSQKQKLLQQAVQETESRLKTLKTASEQAAKTAGNYDAWKAAYTPVQEEIVNTNDKIDKLKKTMKSMEEAGKIDTEEYKQLQYELNESTEKLKVLKTQKKQIDDEFGKPISPEAFDSLQREIIETEQQLKSLERTAGSSSAKLSEISTKTAQFGEKSTAAGRKMMPLTVAIGGIGAASVSMANNFNDAMSQAAGALDMPMSEMEELRQLAIKTGQDTIFSATDAGNAITELAKGGLTEADIKAGALQTTMDLAASSGMDLGNAANVVVQSMGAFGLSANQSAEAANALAGAAAASSTDVEPLTQALAQCSAGAKNAGWDIQETSAVLGRFADAGITGSDAGTSLKTMLRSLAAPSDTAAKKIEELGIQTRDSNGNLLDASSMAQELQNKLGGLDSASRDAALSTIFGSDAMRAATVMMDSGSAGLKKYIDAANDQEAAQRLANSQMSDGSKAIEDLKGSLETAAIQIGDTLAPMVQKLAEFISNLVNKFSALPSGAQKAIIVFAGLLAAIGPLLMIIGQMSLGISAITGAFSKLSTSAKVISFLGKIQTAFTGLFSFLAANPVIIIIAAIIAAVVILYTKCEWFRDGVNAIWESMSKAFHGAWDSIITFFTETIPNAWSSVITFFQGVPGWWNGIWDGVRAKFGEIWNAISNLASDAKNTVVNNFNALKDGIKNAITSLPGIVRGIFDSIRDIISNLISKAWSWGSDFINGLKDGIRSGINNIISAVKGLASKIRSYLHFSRPDVGPLRDYETWMPDFIEGMSKGIDQSAYKVLNSVKRVAGAMSSEMSGGIQAMAGAGSPAVNVNNALTVQVGNEQFDAYIVKTSEKGIGGRQYSNNRGKGGRK
jgi:TP901 family phage tail tape measure protein